MRVELLLLGALTACAPSRMRHVVEAPIPEVERERIVVPPVPAVPLAQPEPPSTEDGDHEEIAVVDAMEVDRPLPEELPVAEAPSTWSYRGSLRIRRAPRATATWRGLTVPGASFEVEERVTGTDCPRSGWGRVGPQAWVCLDSASPTAEPAVMQPTLLAFDSPEPSEWQAYLDTGTYDRAPTAAAEALTPFVYGKRWRRWKAPVWESEAAWLRGDPPDDHLGRVAKYAFSEVRDTPQGTLLVRPDGSVLPADEVHIYPLDRFSGRDLVAAPLGEGRSLGWVHAYGGATLRAEPDSKAEEVGRLSYHQALELGEVQDDHIEVYNVLEGPAWAALGDLRRMLPQTPPEAAPAGAFWLDVDLEEQVLIAMEGDRPVYATLVSTGEGRRNATPLGLYRIMDKAAWWDMASLPDSAEPYRVENVPWTMHFYPRYALHGVFWHWGFGHTASHGCVNLSPKDARWVFERVAPEVYPGWLLAYETPDDPGTLLRVRSGAALRVPDRRRSLD